MNNFDTYQKEYEAKILKSFQNCEHDFYVGETWVGDDDSGGWDNEIRCSKCGFNVSDLPLNTKLRIEIL